uniref:Uncharacterized protein n=1 Tax=Mustela putorius furo TaxID=9669 RepID=M3XSL3_MUSPF
MRASCPKHQDSLVPHPTLSSTSAAQRSFHTGLRPGVLVSEDPSPFPSSGDSVSRAGGGCFLGPMNGAQPCNRQPLSPRGPSPAPRAPAWELAPDAVAIETSSPHKYHRNKKEAPEMMGPSPAEPWTWARPSTLSHPGTLTWGCGCLQRPGSTWGGRGRSPSQGGSSFPFLCLVGQGPTAQLRGALPSEGVHGLRQAKPSPSPQKPGPSLPGSREDGFRPRSMPPRRVGDTHPSAPGGEGGLPSLSRAVPNSPLPPTRLPPTLSRGRLASGPRHRPGARTRAGMGPAPPAPEAPAPRPPPRPHPAPPARPGRGLTASALSWAKMAKVESRSQRQRVRRASRGTVRQPRHDQGPSCGGAGLEPRDQETRFPAAPTTARCPHHRLLAVGWSSSSRPGLRPLL